MHCGFLSCFSSQTKHEEHQDSQVKATSATSRNVSSAAQAAAPLSATAPSTLQHTYSEPDKATGSVGGTRSVSFALSFHDANKASSSGVTQEGASKIGKGEGVVESSSSHGSHGKTPRRVSTVFDPASLTFRSLPTEYPEEPTEGVRSYTGASTSYGPFSSSSEAVSDAKDGSNRLFREDSPRHDKRGIRVEDVQVQLPATEHDSPSGRRRSGRQRRISIVTPLALDKLLAAASINGREDPVSVVCADSLQEFLLNVKDPVVVVKLVPKTTSTDLGLQARPSVHRASKNFGGPGSLKPLMECPPGDLQATLVEDVKKPNTTHGLEVAFVNTEAMTLFNIESAPQFMNVLQELSSYDPQMAVVLQDAVNSLLQGEPSNVVHIMPQLQDQTFSCLSMTLRPCALQDVHEIRPALFMVFGVDQQQTTASTRMMRDYKLLSKVPGTITLFDANGSVMHQNAASIKYMGNLMGRATSNSKGISDPENKLQQIFRFVPVKLDELLEDITMGKDWTSVIPVPASLAASDEGAGLTTAAQKVRNSEAYANIVKSVMSTDLEACLSTTLKRSSSTHHIRSTDLSGYIDMSNRVNQVSVDPAACHVGSYHTTASSTPNTPFLQAAVMDPGYEVGRPPPATSFLQSLSSSPPHYSSHTGMNHPRSSGLGSDVFSSLTVNIQRTYAALMHSDPASHSDENIQPGDALASRVCGRDYFWHEVHATSFSDPVTKAFVILVVQLDVSAKVEAERQLADLTESQLSWLSMLFPRHVIEAMTKRGALNITTTTEAASQGQYRNLSTRHEAVTVLFADIVGFTSMSKDIPATSVMDFLNQLYTAFDALLDVHNVYKVETVGDCYVVAGGLVKSDLQGFRCVIGEADLHTQDHAVQVLEFAKAMVACAQLVKMPHNNNAVQLRIGIHTGPLVSGVIGTRMPRFCLFGDTMNTASRMETTCRPGCIHLSDSTRQLLQGADDLIPTGGVDVKGKGIMSTYLWLPSNHRAKAFFTSGDQTGKAGDQAPPPVPSPSLTNFPQVHTQSSFSNNTSVTSFQGPVGLR